MKQIFMGLLITAFAYTSAQAQSPCQAPAAKKHSTAAHTTKRTTSTITACRLLPYQVCTISADRRSVSCYMTTDSTEQTPMGKPTVYGPTGPMPGKLLKNNVRTVIIKGSDKGAYCKRNAAGNATICYQPGVLIRDENGNYSYGEVVQKNDNRRVSVK